MAEDAPALPQEFERFGEDRAWRALGSIKLELTEKPLTRVQIRNAPGTRMVQIQNGRLLYNWVGAADDDYPRYDQIRPGFDEVLARLKAFLAQEQLGELRINQWEVTYVNHMPRSTVWNSPEDWGRLLDWRALFGRPMPGVQLESIGGGWHYVIEPRRGRLHVDCYHGNAHEPRGPEVLVLKLTARGPVNESMDGAGVDTGLDLGHTVIVQSFASLTSSEAHGIWERTE